MNKQKWESLPADIQQIFTDVSKEWVDKHGNAWNKADEDGKKFVESLNHKTISLSEAEKQRWKQAVQPVIDEYIVATKAKNLPGAEFLADIQTMLQQAPK
jgi:TRAP-type C4-dicarboxylate transport system substrate-binding protein